MRGGLCAVDRQFCSALFSSEHSLIRGGLCAVDRRAPITAPITSLSIVDRTNSSNHR